MRLPGAIENWLRNKGFDDKVLALFSRGPSTRDIQYVISKGEPYQLVNAVEQIEDGYDLTGFDDIQSKIFNHFKIMR